MSIRSIFHDATQLPVNYFRDGGRDGGGRRGHSIPDADASRRWHPVLPVIDRFAIKHEMLKSQKSRGGILGRFLQFCNYKFRFWNSNSGPSLRTGYGTPTMLSQLYGLLMPLKAFSRGFAPPESKMAAKTTPGSDFDRRFRLFAPGFHVINAFVNVYLQE